MFLDTSSSILNRIIDYTVDIGAVTVLGTVPGTFGKKLPGTGYIWYEFQISCVKI